MEFLWLSVRGDSVHRGGEPVRNQGEMNAGTQLTFLFIQFKTLTHVMVPP